MTYPTPTAYIISTPAGTLPSIAFYIGIHPSDVRHLATGRMFDVVYSPNPYVDPHGELAGWYKVRFEVSSCQFRIKGPHERAYKQVTRDTLPAAEAAYYAALWAQAVGQGLAVAV